MRVLHLISSLSGGGAERQLGYLAPRLAERGHHVDVGYLYQGDGAYDHWGGAKIHKLAASGNHDPLLVARLILLVSRTRPDVIQTWITQMDVLGGIAALALRVPWLIRESNSKLAYPKSWKSGIRGRLGQRATAIVANSPGGEEYWREIGTRGRCCVIPNGLPVEAIEAVEATMTSAGLRRRGSCEVELLVVSAGRLDPSKNMDTLIRAVSLMAKLVPVQLIIAGEGHDRRNLEQLAQSMVGVSVELPGFLPREALWSLMKSADVFVLLSDFEGLPNVVMEAMACGSPLVLSDIPAHRSAAGSDAALFAASNQPADVASAIQECAYSRDATLGRRNRAILRARAWSIERMVDGYERELQNCVVAS